MPLSYGITLAFKAINLDGPELEAARNGAEAEQSRLLAELQAASEGAEEKEARKKEAMARRLLTGSEQRSLDLT